MAALLHLASALAWGVLRALALQLPMRLSERLAVGAVFGMLLLLWLPLACAFALGIGPGSWVALAITVALAAVEWRRQRRDPRPPGGALRAGLALLAGDARARAHFLAWLGFGGLVGALCWNHYLLPADDGVYSAGVTWGDVTLHAALANSFLEQGNLHPPRYPLFAGWPLGYPFVSDFSAASMVSLGLSLRAAFSAGTMLSLLALFPLVAALARRWAGDDRPAAPAWALAIFFLSGGLGFLLFLHRLAAGTGPAAALEYDYTHQPDAWLFYANVMGSLFFASRSSSFGMAAGAAALLLLTVDRADRNPTQRPGRLPAGVLIGALPMVHPHSFLALSVAIGVWAALDLRRLRSWADCLVPLLLLSLPQVAWIAAHVGQAEPFARFQTCWVLPADGPGLWATFWIWNAGLLPFLVPLGWRVASRDARTLAAPLLGLFLVANFVRITPHSYDNIKLLAWSHLAASLLTAGWIARDPSAATGARLGRALVAAVLCASGALAVAHELADRDRVLSRDELEVGEFVRTRTPPDAVFLTSSEMHHPVPVIAGRTVLFGSPLWLSAHGIPYAKRERDVALMFRGGPEAAALLEEYAIDYVVVGPRERREFPDLNEAFLAGRARETTIVAGHRLYRLRDAPAGH